MANMNMAHVMPLGAGAADGLMNWSVGRAPAHHRQLAGRIAKAYSLHGNIVGEAKHLVTAKVGNRLMVGGRIIDMASADRLFDAADAVQQTGRAGLHPRAGELLIAAIRFEAAFLRFFQERDGERFITTHVGHFPRRSEEHTSELQSLMRISYAVFCLKKKKKV